MTEHAAAPCVPEEYMLATASRHPRARRATARNLAILGAVASVGIGFAVALSSSANAGTALNAAAANCSGGYVGLTYDDGPNPSNTTNLLNALTSNGLRATMFNIGQNAQANPSLVRAERDAGMWIGNHSWTHPHLTQGSQAQ